MDHVEDVGVHLGELGEQPGQPSGAVGDAGPERQVAARGGQPVPQHVHQQDRVDVAAGQHHDGRGLEPVRVTHHRRDAHGSGRLDDQLRPLDEHEQSLGDRLLVDGDHVVDELLDRRERHVPGPADRDPVGHGGHPGQSLGAPRPQRGRVRRGTLGLHPDDPDAGVVALDGGEDAGEQPAPTGGYDDRPHVRALLDDLQPARRLPGHDVGVVEGVHQDGARSRRRTPVRRRGTRRSWCRRTGPRRRSRGSPSPWGSARRWACRRRP